MFDASRGSLYTALNTTGSSVRATLDPMRACCHALFDTASSSLRAMLYCLLNLYNDRRWRARSGLN
ncbi:MAG TPA: hypothetical protein VMV97_09540 [Sulfuriferula sp.]|nr:hypothetical protein [Sulfuriferula sp.]